MDTVGKERLLRGFGWAVTGFIVLMTVGSLLLLSWGYRAAPPDGEIDIFLSIPYRIVAALGFMPSLLVGTLIVAKKPRNFYGWIWLVLAVMWASLEFATSYGTVGLFLAPGSLPLPWIVVSLGGLSWLFLIATTPFTLLLFPTGKLLGRGWQVVVWVVGLALAIGMSVGPGARGESGLVPLDNPYAFGGRLGDLAAVVLDGMVIVLFLAILASVVSVFVRYRRSTGVERQQIKWFAFGAAWFGLFLILDTPTELPGAWEAAKEAVGFALLPVAVGIAVLRYRLYDIDLIIRRTLIYSAITIPLAGVYLGSVALLQSLFSRISGERSSLAVVLSTLGIAALFTPVRRRVQDFVDRRFYRQKYDAQKTLEQFGEAMRDEVDLEQLIASLTTVVEQTIQPASIGLWVQPTEEKK